MTRHGSHLESTAGVGGQASTGLPARQERQGGKLAGPTREPEGSVSKVQMVPLFLSMLFSSI